MTLRIGGRSIGPSRDLETSEREAEPDVAEPSEPGVFELAETPEEPYDDACPHEPHLHVTANRRFGFPLGLMDLGHQIVTGKDPWNFSSHCPRCGTLVQDRNSRKFRCTAEGCDERWEVSRDQSSTAREAAKHSILGEEFVLLTPEGP